MESLGLNVMYKPPKTEEPGVNSVNRISNLNSVTELESILKNKYFKLFNTNKTVHNFEYNVKLKENFKPVQQKGRVVPIHLQPLVKTELDKLIDEGHVVRETQVGEDQFISPVVITRKDNGTVKIAVDAGELNNNIVKKKAQMPNIEDILAQISVKITSNREKPLFMTSVDLKYAFGQIKLHPETSRHCIFTMIGGKITGHYRFQKGFYGLADMPVIFQEKIDQVIDMQTPA